MKSKSIQAQPGTILPTAHSQGTASWVIRNKYTGKVMFETYDRWDVEHLNTAKYEAVPILKYLQEFNAAVRRADHLRLRADGVAC